MKGSNGGSTVGSGIAKRYDVMRWTWRVMAVKRNVISYLVPIRATLRHQLSPAVHQLTLFWTSVYEGNLVPSKVNRLVSSLRLALITNMVIAAGGVKGCGLVGYGDGKT